MKTHLVNADAALQVATSSAVSFRTCDYGQARQGGSLAFGRFCKCGSFIVAKIVFRPRPFRKGIKRLSEHNGCPDSSHYVVMLGVAIFKGPCLSYHQSVRSLLGAEITPSLPSPLTLSPKANFARYLNYSSRTKAMKISIAPPGIGRPKIGDSMDRQSLA